MAGGRSSNIMGSTVVELSRNNPSLGPSQVVVRSSISSCKRSIIGNGNGNVSIRRRYSSQVLIMKDEEGPSCIFVGPIESASQQTLEALYRQARNAYYSGKPLIVDDMFDKVELKLRWYGSKYVVKYPRCSLRQQSTYADAEGRKILLRFLH